MFTCTSWSFAPTFYAPNRFNTTATKLDFACDVDGMYETTPFIRQNFCSLSTKLEELLQFVRSRDCLVFARNLFFPLPALERGTTRVDHIRNSTWHSQYSGDATSGEDIRRRHSIKFHFTWGHGAYFASSLFWQKPNYHVSRYYIEDLWTHSRDKFVHNFGICSQSRKWTGNWLHQRQFGFSLNVSRNFIQSGMEWFRCQRLEDAGDPLP